MGKWMGVEVRNPNMGWIDRDKDGLFQREGRREKSKGKRLNFLDM